MKAKTTKLILAALLAAGAALTGAADTAAKGVWLADFVAATNAAFSTGTPIVLVASKSGCSHCAALKTDCEASSFKSWMAEGRFYFCRVEKDANNAYSYISTAGGTSTKITEFPMVSLVWPKAASATAICFAGRSGRMLVSAATGSLAAQLSASADKFFAGYVEGPSARFAVGGTPSDRLEAQAGASVAVAVPLVRTNTSEDEKYELQFTLPGASAAETLPVAFAAGAAEPAEWPVVRTAAAVGAAGDEIALALVKDGQTVATSAIAVAEREISPKNPLWIGERDAATLKPGEWTMDVDLALACAKTAEKPSLTLVGGSLWCPDCVNVDANLVETEVFRDWATARGVYCAALDVPAFPKGGETCLLTYTATSVSDRYVNATVPPQDRVQSGAGYLSRKGVTPDGDGGASASDVLARNLNLVTNSVTAGGLCRPECLDAANAQTGSWKTGVPCFLVRASDGRVVGRLDQFSNVSPTNTDAAAAYVQRLDELLALADDPTEELNAHWSTATTEDCAMSVRGGAATSTISAIDLSDYWRLTGRDRWTRTTIAVCGRIGDAPLPVNAETSASVANADQSGSSVDTGDNGRAASPMPPLGNSATTENDVRLSLWKISNGKAEKVATAAGSLAAGVALPAQELSADATLDYFVQVEALASSAAFALERTGDSTAAYELTATSADDAGSLAFAAASATASEADAKKAGGALRVTVPVARTGGATGEASATLAVDDASTAFPDRYRIVTDTVAWADGELGTKSFAVDVLDDANADGTQILRLVLDGAADAGAFALTILDNDKANVGKVAFADAEPALAKKGTIVAEEGTTVKIGVARTGGASGDVGCSIKATAGTFADAPAFAWKSRESGTQWAELTLPTLAACPSGKVTVSFDALDGIKADSSAKTITIQLIGADAPRFEASAQALDLTRYCAVSQEVAVASLADGAKAKVAKLSGSLPSGVTVKLVGDQLVISGTPSAKTGTFEAVYQVSQVEGRTTTPGLTIRVSFTVTDVAALDPSATGANPSVATKRVIPDMMVVDDESRRLVGLIANLTIPTTGRCTAKYKCAEGTLSFASTSWSGYDEESGALTATLTVSKKPDYALVVTAAADGGVTVALTDPAFEEELTAEAPEAWSKANPATAWVGRATATFATPSGDALALGSPIVTLKMTDSLAKTGRMQYAGYLPSGQAFSGYGTLVEDGVDAALLPIYYRSSKDCLTAVLRIEANGAVQAVTAGADILPWWSHTEAIAEASGEVVYGQVLGSWIDAQQDLLDTVDPMATGHALVAGDEALGEGVAVEITSTAAKLDAAEAKPVGATLSLNRTTGLVSGKFKTLDSAGKTVTAYYRAVLLPDWGDGCLSCGGTPWSLGAFWFSEKVTGDVNGKAKTVSVKVGDAVVIEAK